MPGSVESAPIKIVFHNEGSRPYEAKFARLNDGMTMGDVQQAMPKGEEEVFKVITLAGEIPRTGAGQTGSLTVRFAPGHYLVVDPRFAAKGMVRPFEVNATDETVDEPDADAEVLLTDFAIDMPDELPAETLTVQVTNNGGQTHEVAFLRDGDKLTRDTPAVLPFNPGTTIWQEISLEPGVYLAVCYFPDSETGKPHIALGMETTFEVK